MAIFYKHIKGTTNATDNNNGLWTWVKWSDAILSTSTLCSPEIWVTDQNKNLYPGSDTDQSKNLGHVITSKAVQQNIENHISIPKVEMTQIDTPDGWLYISAEKIRWYDTAWDGINFETEWIISCQSQYDLDSKLNYVAWNNDGHKVITLDHNNGNITTSGSIESSDSHIEAKTYIKSHGYIEATTYVKAQYFNATSDIRAKENLSPLSTNALDIIKKVQVYTFNYKNNPKERTIGVIAQEFLDKKLDDVSLVANEGASGENGDYMSIKETKLIYLLLKGMQEQQTEIDDLKEQIKKLESK